MLDFFRNHKRLMQVLLALFILPGLGLVGIQSTRHASRSGPDVASVNGTKIDYREYSVVLQERLQQIQSMFGASFDVQTINTPAFRSALLDSLIEQRLMTEEAKEQRLYVPDEVIRSALLNIPAIAKLRKPDGSIDLKAYNQLLAAQGMTAEQLDERVRSILAAGQLSQSIAASAFVPSILVTPFLIASLQQREVQSMHFLPHPDLKNAPPTQEALQAYYDSHVHDFIQPEQAVIEYVILNAAHFAPTKEPSEAALKKYYQEHLAEYKNEERVRARHILLMPAEGASEQEIAAVRAQAEELLVQLRANPKQFDALAKKFSQDPGSASRGGDLGYFGRRQMDPPFEAAAFSLQRGQISEIVQSQYGYHIIQMIDSKPAVTLAFPEVRARIVATLQNQEAAQRFSEASALFSDLLYEQSASLAPVAEKFGLTRKTATVTHTANSALSASHPLNQAAFLNAVFSEEVVKAKHNTTAIEVGERTLIAARVVRHTPKAQKPLRSVIREVKAKVIAIQAAERAKKEGRAKLAALQAQNGVPHGAPADFSPAMILTRANTGSLPAQAIDAIFKVNASARVVGAAEAQKASTSKTIVAQTANAKEPGTEKPAATIPPVAALPSASEKGQENAVDLPQYIGVDLGPTGYVIYRLNAIRNPMILPNVMESAQQQLGQIAGQIELSAYTAAVRKRLKVKIYGLPAAQQAN